MTTPPLASRLAALQPSAIIEVAQAARELKKQGKPVLSLSIGVPGFTPPTHVYDAAHAALEQDDGDYLPGRGSPALIQAFRESLAVRGFAYDDTELCAQVGGKGALFNLMLALLEPGEQVVIPAPYWASYPEMVRLAGGEPVSVKADAAAGYKITPAQLQEALATQPRVLLWNNPSNPTGMLYTPSETAALAEVVAAAAATNPRLWVISDDIYDMLVFSGTRAAHLLETQPQLRDRTVLVQSISKTYGMPGWRVGLVAAPKPLTDALLALTSQSFTNLPAVTMAAAAAALSGPQDFLHDQKTRLQRQRDDTLAALQQMGLPCPVPEGAFYAFPQIGHLFGKTTPAGTTLTDDVAFCRAVLAEALVALVPGGAFGDAHAIRISYAGDPTELREALARLADFVGRLT